ncbi:MAG: hypothetical protein Kow0042_24760 [Calditrichia bacterium]
MEGKNIPVLTFSGIRINFSLNRASSKQKQQTATEKQFFLILMRLIQPIRCQPLKFIFYGIFIAGILGVGCTTVKELVKIQKPDVSVEQVRVTGLSFDGTDLLFDIKIRNPNQLSATLFGFDYNLFINETSFLQGKQDTEQRIEALGESHIQLPISLSFKDLYQTVQTLRDKDSSAYRLECGFTFDLPVLGATRIPLTQKGTLPLPKLPTLAVRNLRLKNLGFTRADLELELEIFNPNAFSVILEKLNYSFLVNNQNWATGLTEQSNRISAKTSSTFTLPLSLNILEMGQSITHLLTGNTSLDYQFRGEVDFSTSLQLLGKTHLPFEKSGKINLTH